MNTTRFERVLEVEQIIGRGIEGRKEERVEQANIQPENQEDEEGTTTGKRNTSRESLNKLFNELDLDGSGFLDEEEFRKALSRLQLPALKDADWLKIANDAHGGAFCISRDTFYNLVASKEENLRKMFNEMDLDGNGHISFEEFLFGLRKLHPTREVVEPAAKKLFTDMDTNNSGTIEFEEWLRMLCLLDDMSTEAIFGQLEHWVDSAVEDLTIPNKPERFSLQWVLSSLAAGGIAGATSKTITAPLDRLKVLLQVQSKLLADKTIFEGVKEMYNEGGIRSFWRGNFTNVIKIIPESALIFTLFDIFQKTFAQDPSNPRPSERFFCGGLSGLLTRITVYPLDTMKTRLMVAPSGMYNGLYDCAKKIFYNEGPKSFYRGLASGLAGVVPYVGLNMTIYETLKKKIREIQSRDSDKSPSKLFALGCGTVSSACAQLLVYPSALIMTRMQAQGIPQQQQQLTQPITQSQHPIINNNNKQPPIQQSIQQPLQQAQQLYQQQKEPHSIKTQQQQIQTIIKKQTMKGTIMETWHKDGLKGFYKGLGMNYVKTLPSVGISFMVYETLKEILKV